MLTQSAIPATEQRLVNKLDIYQGLGVTEVWQWQNGQFQIYHLRSTGYEVIASSELLPNLDFLLLTRYVKLAAQFDAVMEFRESFAVAEGKRLRSKG
jgi:hypothetical protein